MQDGRVYFGVGIAQSFGLDQEFRILEKRRSEISSEYCVVKNDVIIDFCKPHKKNSSWKRTFCISYDKAKDYYKLSNCEKMDVFVKLTTPIVRKIIYLFLRLSQIKN